MDNRWSLIFNILGKLQSVSLIAAGLIADGVVGVGVITTIVAAASLGAGLADFSYSYECGRFVSTHRNTNSVTAALRQVPPKFVIGAVVSVVAYEVAVGHGHQIDLIPISSLALLGAALVSTGILLQVAYGLDQVRASSSILGVSRTASGVLAVGLAFAGNSINGITVVLALAEGSAAIMLWLLISRTASSLPTGDTDVGVGVSYLWLGIGTTINTFANRSDVLLVSALTSPVQLGIYSIASQAENAIESLAVAPAAPLLVHAARARSSGADLAPLIKVARASALRIGTICAVGVPATFALGAALLEHRPDIAALHTWHAFVAVTIVSIAAILVAMGGINVSVLAAHQRYRAIAASRALSGLVGVVAFVVLTPPLGALGAAFGAWVRDVAFLGTTRFAGKRPNRPRICPPPDLGGVPW